MVIRIRRTRSRRANEEERVAQQKTENSTTLLSRRYGTVWPSVHGEMVEQLH